MKASDLPLRLQTPFGNSAGAGYIRTVPVPSQIGIQDGAASFTDGFPPLNFLPVGAGGIPPFGQDMNGIFNLLSGWTRFQATGMPPVWDSTFSTAVGGYPKGAFLSNATTIGQYWVSQVDDNPTNPDAGGANWLAFPGSYSRNRLLAPATIYVNPSTGNDSNPGTFASPFATLNRAYSFAQSLDLGGQVLTGSCAAGTYAPFNAAGPVVGQSNATSLLFLATGTANLTNTGTTGYAANAFSNANVCFQGPWIFSAPNATGTGGGGIQAQTGGQIYLNGGGIQFGAANLGAHISSAIGGQVVIGASYGIQNISAARHFFASQGGIFSGGNVGTTITLTGTPAISIFAESSGGGQGYIGMLNIGFVGSFIGQRYLIDQYAAINTYSGGNVNFFPGTIAGVKTAGSYD